MLDNVEAHGAVAAISPHTFTIVKQIPLEKCEPAGLDLGPNDDLLVGCSDDAVAAGFPPESLIISASSGAVVAHLPKIGGSDEVWSDTASGRYYLARRGQSGWARARDRRLTQPHLAGERSDRRERAFSGRRRRHREDLRSDRGKYCCRRMPKGMHRRLRVALRDQPNA